MKTKLLIAMLLFAATLSAQIERRANTVIIESPKASQAEIIDVLLIYGYFIESADTIKIKTEPKRLQGLSTQWIIIHRRSNDLYIQSFVKGFVVGSGEVTGMIAHEMGSKKYFEELVEIAGKIGGAKISTRRL